jgi:hypothetical protein
LKKSNLHYHQEKRGKENPWLGRTRKGEKKPQKNKIYKQRNTPKTGHGKPFAPKKRKKKNRLV